MPLFEVFRCVQPHPTIKYREVVTRVAIELDAQWVPKESRPAYAVKSLGRFPAASKSAALAAELDEARAAKARVRR